MKNCYLLGTLFGLLIFISWAAVLHYHHRPDPQTNNDPNRLDTEPVLATGYGSLSKIYEDIDFGFSLRYPATFRESQFPTWTAIVDNDTKASIWLGLCSPACTHVVRPPAGNSIEEYKRDYTITWKESADIPYGEGRRVHIIESHEFTTSKGIHALEQRYETTGFEVETGTPILSRCAEDTPCEVVGPDTRYVFFAQGKAPYVILSSYRSSFDSEVQIGREVADAVSY